MQGIEVRIGGRLARRCDEEFERRPAAQIEARAGIVRTEDGLRLLLADGAAVGEQGIRTRLFRPPVGLRRVSHLYWSVFDERRYDEPVLDLGLLPDGGCTGALLVGREALPIAHVERLAGSEPAWRPGEGAPPLPDADPAGGRFSRTIGALGGRRAHDRLALAHVAVVGAARLGSHLAEAFARAGVGRLTLIDPDLLELHSLDAMHCDPALLGAPKVEAVRALVTRGSPAVRIDALPLPAQAPESLAALAQADLIASAPDDNRARFAATLAASAHLIPHLDLGTGIFELAGRWSAGCDLRFVLPEDGCLSCIGGLDLTPRSADWRAQRRGSLRSLNLIAVGQALTLYERWLAGGLRTSVWQRLTLDADGSLRSRREDVARDAGCPVCGSLLARGDSAFGEVG